VGWLEADEQFLYFTTCRHANGLPPREGPLHFVVWDPAGRVVHDHVFTAEELPGRIACAAGLVLVAVGNGLRIFDPRRMAFAGLIDVGGPPECLVSRKVGRVAVFSAGRLFECDPVARQVQELCAVPKEVYAATVTPDGRLYFAESTRLHVIDA
jgi:hypothetical protein